MGHSGDLRSGQPIKGAFLLREAAAAGHRLLHRRALVRDELGSSTKAPSSVRSQPEPAAEVDAVPGRKAPHWKICRPADCRPNASKNGPG